MNVFEIAKQLETQIELFRNDNNTFVVSMAHCYVHSDGAFESACASGRTIENALLELSILITGHRVCNKKGVKLKSMEGKWFVPGVKVEN